MPSLMKPDFRATDEAGKLRLLVYMVRCAYAHSTAYPRRNVTNKKMRILTVNVEGRTITLDLPRLHGQLFEVALLARQSLLLSRLRLPKRPAERGQATFTGAATRRAQRAIRREP